MSAYISRDEAITRIRAALRSRSGKAWSVTGGRGTAYGWIHISVPPARKSCDMYHQWDTTGVTCRFCSVNYLETGRYYDPKDCPSHACDSACYRNYISPAEREELAALLGMSKRVHPQGVSIPSSNGYYIEHIDRAEGRAPSRFGERYWD